MNNILEISDRLKQYRINYPMTQRDSKKSEKRAFVLGGDEK